MISTIHSKSISILKVQSPTLPWLNTLKQKKMIVISCNNNYFCHHSHLSASNGNIEMLLHALLDSSFITNQKTYACMELIADSLKYLKSKVTRNFSHLLLLLQLVFHFVILYKKEAPPFNSLCTSTVFN